MVKFSGARKEYGNIVAVKNLSLEVAPGECFGFLGPNGAGKTTAIKMLAGLLVPTAGSVAVDGHDVQAEPEEAKAVIGFVPDKPFIYEKLTGREFLDFVLDIHGFPRGKAAKKRAELLEMFSLTEWQEELVESYSHGMKQKLVITGALIHDPKLLVIDEPMVGLDPYGHTLVKGLFRKMCEEGNSVFMSTHTLAVAQELCHRVAIIEKGEIVAIGTVAELREKAQSDSEQLEAIFLKLTSPSQ
ncbi:MAG: ABC transporter ATP-binding protein [Nitrospinae bacterium]|nr:ABC transporter ATP-binding protein [Nitrospinota bacterium]